MGREEGGPRGLPWRMRVDVSAGLRRMNEGRRVMLPRYCTARHERISKGGGGEGGWLPVPPPPPPPPPPRSAPSTNASILYPDGFAKSPLSMSCYACRGPWWIPWCEYGETVLVRFFLERYFRSLEKKKKERKENWAMEFGLEKNFQIINLWKKDLCLLWIV